MPGRIRKPFSRLFEAFRLQPQQLDLELQDEVYPVVLLATHLEENPLNSNFQATGATGPGVLSSINIPDGGTGTYQMVWTYAYSIAIALVGVGQQVTIEQAEAAAVQRSLAVIEYGQAGNLADTKILVIPRIKLNAGQTIRANLQTGHLINDRVASFLYLQQV